MGKAKTTVRPRHDPLYAQMTGEGNNSKVRRTPKAKPGMKEKTEEAFIDSKLSRNILRIAREQQNEIDAEELEEVAEGEDEEEGEEKTWKGAKTIKDSDEEDEEEDDDDEEEFGDGRDFEYDELEIDEADLEILNKFLPSAPRERKNLADLIMEKIEAQNAMRSDIDAQGGNIEDSRIPPGLSPKVVEVYTKVGQLLSRYKSGKLPKAFKIIPSLSNWEEVLYLTSPENWTPHATFQATKIFVSNLKVKQSQRFFSLVLLDRVRDDIQENKKLNYHLYMALKKGLYKPAAFFKGILFPLCESGTCTLKEATIIGSVVTRVSIPVLHSSAALLRLAEMDYTGSNSIFIRILLDKKYALPYKVVDALVSHFVRFKTDPRTMPVLWHQSFLVFAQRYKQDLVPEQKDALLEVLRMKGHHAIGPEIRREIVNSVARGDLIREPEDDLMDLL